MSLILNNLIIGIFPAILFYILYNYVSFTAAVIAGFLISLTANIFQFKKTNKISLFYLLGFIGVVVQTIAGLLVNNEQSYFLVPAILNFIYGSLFFGSLFMKENLVMRISREFLKSKIDLTPYIPIYKLLTIIWGGFFYFKGFIKVIAILNLSVNELIWLNWFLGSPVYIALFALTVWLPNWYHKNVLINKKKQE